MLAVRKVSPELNNTRYQCQIRLLSNSNGRLTPYPSLEGRLIIRCRGKIIIIPLYYCKRGHSYIQPLMLRAYLFMIMKARD